MPKHVRKRRTHPGQKVRSQQTELRLQALVYDILPPPTGIIDYYAVGLEKLLANGQCPFSGVTGSGRVWRKVPESDARSVTLPMDSVESQQPFHYKAVRISVSKSQ